MGRRKSGLLNEAAINRLCRLKEEMVFSFKVLHLREALRASVRLVVSLTAYASDAKGDCNYQGDQVVNECKGLSMQMAKTLPHAEFG